MVMTNLLASLSSWSIPLLAQAAAEDDGSPPLIGTWQWIGLLVVIGLVILMLVLRKRQM
jgi:hypothetical protein